MKNLLILVVAFLVMGTTSANAKKKAKKEKEVPVVYTNDFPAYVIYDKTGKQVTYTEMIASLKAADVCLFGELHDDPIAHWLEKTVTAEMYEAHKDSLVLGGEMWETDNQLVMDELLIEGSINGSTYEESSRNWPNWKTDYKDLVVFAKKKGLKFVCTNIPRRYANMVYKKGIEYLDSLSNEAKAYLPPLPIYFDLEQPAYKKMVDLFGADKDGGKSSMSHSPMGKYKSSNLVKAQAIKDATMAHNILKNWEKGQYFLHYNGCYHSNGYQGIYFYLKHYEPEMKIQTISVSRQERVLELDPTNNQGDFNIVVSDAMTRTYLMKLF